jgi:Domain of unknown function (DUF4399)
MLIIRWRRSACTLTVGTCSNTGDVMTRILLLSLILAGALVGAMAAERSVYFVEPKDGATVDSKFKVVFGARGWQVRPLGDMTDGTGHHHLLINPAAPVEPGKLIPVDQPGKILHFGKGETETTLDLAPGRWTLQLQLGDGAHNSLGPDGRASITVTVK